MTSESSQKSVDPAPAVSEPAVSPFKIRRPTPSLAEVKSSDMSLSSNVVPVTIKRNVRTGSRIAAGPTGSAVHGGFLFRINNAKLPRGYDPQYKWVIVDIEGTEASVLRGLHNQCASVLLRNAVELQKSNIASYGGRAATSLFRPVTGRPAIVKKPSDQIPRSMKHMLALIKDPVREFKPKGAETDVSTDYDLSDWNMGLEPGSESKDTVSSPSSTSPSKGKPVNLSLAIGIKNAQRIPGGGFTFVTRRGGVVHDGEELINEITLHETTANLLVSFTGLWCNDGEMTMQFDLIGIDVQSVSEEPVDTPNSTAPVPESTPKKKGKKRSAGRDSDEEGDLPDLPNLEKTD